MGGATRVDLTHLVDGSEERYSTVSLLRRYSVLQTTPQIKAIDRLVKRESSL